MSKKTTISEIAERAGVSVATVSRVFNSKELHKVSAETRSRIEALIAELDYHPNAHARRLVSGRSRLIGFIMPSLRSPIVNSAALEALTLRAAERGYGVLTGLAWQGSDEASVMHMIRQGAEGVIWQPANELDGMILQQLSAARCRIVWFRKEVDHKHPQVVNDEKQTGLLAAEYLIRNGAERLLFIGRMDSHMEERLPAFKAAAARLGVHKVEVCHQTDFKEGFPELLRKNLDGRCGIFHSSHQKAQRIYRELRKLDHPACRLCAYGDLELALEYDLPVTIIAPDSEALGRAAFDSLEMLLEGKRPADIIIPPILAVRERV